METLGDYARRGGAHFVPLEAIPVVSPDTSVSDALGVMKVRGTVGVLVGEGRQRYRLLLQQHLSKLDLPGRRLDPVKISFADILGGTPSLPTVDASRPREEARAAMRGDSPFRSVAVVGGAEVIGLHTEAEDWRHAFFTTPTVYQCARGHNWPPPPPASCPVDGTGVSPV